MTIVGATQSLSELLQFGASDHGLWAFSIVQIAEQLNLSLATLQQELESWQINVKNIHRTLRQNFPHNDEKIFAAITVALKLRFTPPLSNLNLKGH